MEKVTITIELEVDNFEDEASAGIFEAIEDTATFVAGENREGLLNDRQGQRIGHFQVARENA